MKKKLLSVIFLLLIVLNTVDAQAPDFSLLKGFGGDYVDVCKDVCTDANGNIFIVGNFNNYLTLGSITLTTSAEAGFVARLDTAGNCVWAKSIGTSIDKIAIDNSNNLLIGGGFKDSLLTSCDTIYMSYGMTDNFVSKMDGSGNCIWVKGFGGTGYDFIQGFDLKNSDIYLTGSFSSYMYVDTILMINSGYGNAYLIKMDQNGNPTLTKVIKATGINYGASGLDVVCDNLGNIILTGTFEDTLTIIGTPLISKGLRDVFILKLNANGNIIWAKSVGGPGTDVSTSIAIGESDNIYTVGEFKSDSIWFGSTVHTRAGLSSNFDFYIAKLDQNGNYIWTKSFGGVQDETCKRIVTDNFGNSLITGSFKNTTLNFDTISINAIGAKMFVSNFDSNGNFMWAVNSSPIGTFSDNFGIGLTRDAQGNIFVTGNYFQQMYVGGADTLVSNGPKDAYLARLGNATFGLIPNSSLITGKIFHESITNCNIDISEPFLNGRIIKATPGNYYAISNMIGDYNLLLPGDTGASINYSIEAISGNDFAFQATPICPLSNLYTTNISATPDTISGFDFGYHLSPCHYLKVQIGSNMRRRCFTNLTSISYNNIGGDVAPNAYIIVEFPHYVVPVSSSIPWIYINDSTYRFDLGNLAPGFNGAFNITDSVKCISTDQLGIMQCTKATIYPATNCSSPNWSGAQIGVHGNCLNGLVYLDIFNDGLFNMTDSAAYEIHFDSILVSTAKVKLNAGDTLHLQANANGSSVSLQVNQVAFHPTEQFVNLTIEGCNLDTSQLVYSYVNYLAMAQAANSKISCKPIIGACDPNDKQVFPIGFTQNHIVSPETRLEFNIRFQNTGNDTAFNVLVVDTLSENLNPETFEMGVSSHTYQLSMETNNNGLTALKWNFNGINLVDSFTNLHGSQGFIQFRISPKTGLPLGTQVLNEVGIYFDNNPPVITNQTLTTFDNITFLDSTLNGAVIPVPLITGFLGSQTPSAIGVLLYPNPVLQNELTVEFYKSGSLTIYNAQGVISNYFQHIVGKQDLNLQLMPGVYIAKIQTEKGISTVKIIIL